MDKKPTVSVLDLLLRPELPDVRGEQAVQAVLLGCVEPDWKDRSLLAPGSVATPIDAIKSKLTAGEIDELYIEIQMLSGYIDRALADVKNA